MNIQIDINDYHMVLGDSDNSVRLKSSGLKKVGFLRRAMMPLPIMPGDVLYSVMNPVLHINGSTTHPNMRDSDVSMMYATNCTAFYNQQRLRLLMCWVQGSSVAARRFVDEVRRHSINQLGEPTSRGEPYIWKQEGQFFASEMGTSGSTAFMHWRMD